MAAQPVPQSPHHPLSTSGTSNPPQRALGGRAVASLLHADSACICLTCFSVCRRTLCELSLGSQNILNSLWRALTRSRHGSGGTGALREKIAHEIGCSAICRAWACVARRCLRVGFEVFYMFGLLQAGCIVSYVLYEVYGSGPGRN